MVRVSRQAPLTRIAPGPPAAAGGPIAFWGGGMAEQHNDVAGESKRSLIAVTVMVPFDKISEVEDFAAKLRGEAPYAVALFPGRPPSKVRKFLKDNGLQFINGIWQGQINKKNINEAKFLVDSSGGKLIIGKSESEILRKRMTVEVASGVHISLLEDIKTYQPYTIAEAVEAVERVFRIYAKRNSPAEELAKETNSRIRRHWIKSKKIDIKLPKKPLMSMSLYFMKRVEDQDSRRFSTAEATRFFNEIGYDTIVE